MSHFVTLPTVTSLWRNFVEDDIYIYGTDL